MSRRITPSSISTVATSSSTSARFSTTARPSRFTTPGHSRRSRSVNWSKLQPSSVILNKLRLRFSQNRYPLRSKRNFRGRPVDATASRSSRFDGSDSLGGLAENAAARCRSVTEFIANIDVGAMAAWHRSSAAAVLQGIIPARLELRRHHSVRVAHAVPAIDIVAVAARRRATVTAVLDFLNWKIAIVQCVSRSTQLKRERQAGNACEHFHVPPR